MLLAEVGAAQVKTFSSGPVSLLLIYFLDSVALEGPGSLLAE